MGVVPAAGLVEMNVLVCLGAVLICLARVGTRLPWVLIFFYGEIRTEFPYLQGGGARIQMP